MPAAKFINHNHITHTMKSIITRFSLLVMLLLTSTFIIAQQKPYVSPVPATSPMQMKPEMTEIWNPEVKTITPGKKDSEAPSDAIVVFNGKNLDQWVSQTDNCKPAAWKIINND